MNYDTMFIDLHIVGVILSLSRHGERRMWWRPSIPLTPVMHRLYIFAFIIADLVSN
jgi:hypothetical protein